MTIINVIINDLVIIKVLLLSMLKTVVLLNNFVETMRHSGFDNFIESLLYKGINPPPPPPKKKWITYFTLPQCCE